MSRYGCENCKWLKCYPGDRWTPPDYECTKGGPETEELLIRIWENGETWTDGEEPLCADYKEFVYPDDTY